MVFPLEELVKYSDNIYEITVASSRRAYQMAKIEDPEIELNDGKVVSLAARQVFDNKVTFKIEQQ
jgi:DNA-directed RNA polymerase subunit omega